MPGEGIGSIFSAALGYVPTLFSYFNPSRSPYYAMTVACIVGLCVIFLFDSSAWVAAYIPIGVVLIVLAWATMSSPKFLFTITEYNDQLKFARSLAVTTAVLCIIFLAHNPKNPLGYGPVIPPEHVATDANKPLTCSLDCESFRWSILIVYLFCIVQIALFLAYHFVFEKYDESVVHQDGVSDADPASLAGAPAPGKAERNYVQIALIMCAYLAGMTWVTDRAPQTFTFEFLTLILFAAIWLLCAVNVVLFVARNFSLQPPVDRVQPLHPPGTNVVTFKQLRA